MLRTSGYFFLVAVMAACAIPQGRESGQGRTDGRPASAGAAGPKRITVAIAADLPSVRTQLSRGSGAALPGSRELEQLLHAGLAVEDHRGELHAQLADAVPNLDNGLWRVLPDGRMETTWRIRPHARWHDGVSFTADDVLFSARLSQDRDFPQFREPAYDSVEGVDAPNALTVTVRWSQPFIEADGMYSGWGGVQPVPFPRHLLESAYLENRSGLLNLPYWRDEFVGAGPFKLREWVPGSYLVLDAFDDYVLGRPKIDEIQVKLIPDPNTLAANIMAGAIDTHVGRGLSLDQTLQIRDQWRGGQVEFTPGGAIKIWPQLNNPSPAAVGDVRFRRALFHAMDRQQLADTLMVGLSSVAHSILIPDDREFAAADPSVVRYEYDPRKAAQLLEGLGYVRGGDGNFRDAAGQQLSVELRAVIVDLLQKTTQAIADDWRKAGVGVETQTIPPARQADREYRGTFPGFDTSRGNNSAEAFKTFLSSEARVRERGFAGTNFPSYMNAELDTLIQRYLVTIPFPERMQVTGRIVQHMSDQVIVLPVFYDVLGTVTGNRLRGVPSSAAQGKTTTWNAHEWDVI